MEPGLIRTEFGTTASHGLAAGGDGSAYGGLRSYADELMANAYRSRAAAEPGVVAALAMTAAGNLFGRWMQRPGALIRLPGIIMLVPGSASLRGLLTLVQEQDMSVGQTALLTVLNVVMALVAGLLFGNLLVPARKNL